VLRAEQSYRSEQGVYFTFIYLLAEGSIAVTKGTVLTFPSVVSDPPCLWPLLDEP
jgi:hypothetical protein